MCPLQIDKNFNRYDRLGGNMSLNIELLRSSFEKVKPIANDVADKFYENLWTDYPASKALFDGVDMKKQKGALLGSLVHIVDHLESEKLAGYLKNMGARHLKYNTEDEHYDLVGASLLKTFAYFFDDEWTEELELAWTDAYGVISSVMIEGANEAREKKASEVDIRTYALKLCEDLVSEVLDEELEQLVKKTARPRIKQLILKTLDEESKNLLKKPISA
jgi:hemoglobin-like flavoprotein